jgi:hypothetical protein
VVRWWGRVMRRHRMRRRNHWPRGHDNRWWIHDDFGPRMYNRWTYYNRWSVMFDHNWVISFNNHRRLRRFDISTTARKGHQQH